MLTVACVLRSGGVYDATWVERLRAGVARHLRASHRFVCLSDADVLCERIPLEHDWPGWWSKLELFKLQGPLLYYDLDTAIVDDQSDIAHQALGGFTMLRDFYHARNVGSGVMAWGGDMRGVYDQFAARAGLLMRQRRPGIGDQAYIQQAVQLAHIARWQDRLPGQIVSYKVHCRPSTGAVIPLNARVVCLHGQPKFADMPSNDAVRRAWELAA